MPVATAVVVHAHPDDEAIFTGATIHQLVEQDVRVVLVTATSGEAGSRGSRCSAARPSGAAVARNSNEPVTCWAWPGW